MDFTSLAAWMASSPVAAFVKSSEWIWPGLEIFHFIGLALVVGVAGVFDARLLGFARQIPIGALNTLIPWAVVGIVINGITGLMFVFAEPTRYLGNPAFTGPPIPTPPRRRPARHSDLNAPSLACRRPR